MSTFHPPANAPVPLKIVAMAGNDHHLFAIDREGYAWDCVYTTRWSPWQQLFSSKIGAGMDIVATDIAAVAGKSSWVFITDTKGRIWKSSLSGETWGTLQVAAKPKPDPWDTPPYDNIPSTPPARALTALKGNYAHIFALDSYGMFWHTYPDNDAGNPGWTAGFGYLNGNLNQPVAIDAWSFAFVNGQIVMMAMCSKDFTGICQLQVCPDESDTWDFDDAHPDQLMNSWEVVGQKVRIVHVSNSGDCLAATDDGKIWWRASSARGIPFQQIPAGSAAPQGVTRLLSHNHGGIRVFALDRDGVLWTNLCTGPWSGWTRGYHGSPQLTDLLLLQNPAIELVGIGRGNDPAGKGRLWPAGTLWSLQEHSPPLVWSPDMGAASSRTREWMRLLVIDNPRLQASKRAAITVGQLSLAGSHHSNSKTLGTEIAQDSNTAVKAWAKFENRADWVRDMARTQNTTVTEQLEMGVRYLDCRVDYEPDKPEHFYTYHSTLGGPLYQVFRDVVAFLKSTSRELVIIEMSELDTTVRHPDRLTAFCSMVERELGAFIYKRESDRLAVVPLSKIVAHGSRVILMIEQNDLQNAYKKPAGSRGLGGITDDQYELFWFLVDEIQDTSFDEKTEGGETMPLFHFSQGLVKKYNPSKDPPMFKLQWLRPWKAHFHFIGKSGVDEFSSLEDLEVGQNAMLPDFVRTTPGKFVYNVLFVDFFAQSWAFAMSMELNGALASSA